MKQAIVTVCLLVLAATSAVNAQSNDQRPAGFSFVIGPRVGGSYTFMTPSDYSTFVQKLYPPNNYFPANTLFGVNFEQRILLGHTRSHFAFQEIVLIGGLEQSIAMPTGAFLIGYRDFSGFEMGVGPIVNMAGVGVVAALGWTLSFQGVFIPIDVSVTLPSGARAASLGLTTGFNFEVRRSSPTETR